MNWSLFLRKKDGKLSVEYIAIIVLGLAVLLILIIFTDSIRNKIIDGLRRFFEDTIRRR